MKVGNLVRFAGDPSEFDTWHHAADDWGTGIILSIEVTDTSIGGNIDAEILWPDVGITWETTLLLEIIDECRTTKQAI